MADKCFGTSLRSTSVCLLVLLISNSVAAVDEENASNPLAEVKNTDLRWQYLGLDGAHLNDIFIDGAFMANDKLKIKYALHYWKTNITGQSENGLESAVAKGIYFPAEGVRGNLKYRIAVGVDWIGIWVIQVRALGVVPTRLPRFLELPWGFKVAPC